MLRIGVHRRLDRGNVDLLHGYHSREGSGAPHCAHRTSRKCLCIDFAASSASWSYHRHSVAFGIRALMLMRPVAPLHQKPRPADRRHAAQGSAREMVLQVGESLARLSGHNGLQLADIPPVTRLRVVGDRS